MILGVGKLDTNKMKYQCFPLYAMVLSRLKTDARVLQRDQEIIGRSKQPINRGEISFDR